MNARALILRTKAKGPFTYTFEVDGEVAIAEVSKQLAAAFNEVRELGKALPGTIERVIITFVSTPPPPAPEP